MDTMLWEVHLRASRFCWASLRPAGGALSALGLETALVLSSSGGPHLATPPRPRS